MPLPVTFGNLTNPTLPQLDQNFAALGNLVVIPCFVSGTNAIAMTPAANTPTITTLTQYSGIVSVTNTSLTTINVAGLGAFNAYKDSPSGPIPLTGGELVAGNAFTASFDPALNSGAGGFHVFYNTSQLLTRSGSVTFSVVAAFGNQTQNFTLSGASIGDVVMLGLPAAAGTLGNLVFSSFVAAAGTVGIMAVNAGSVSLTPPSGLYRAAVLRLS